ncbi:periplasmic heavy metal sensor [Horticoccus luteus]|uniref:Periplasmic heavy metal sensor n=1 Tax=Horticoccus luteus TaxID=2862869 RepID=A0A8F9TVE5_9BACT|nr:periplasmic heavy metal sensor [Horticoccus luteus]QYM78830.1 periplasmic heavy metal sensor [Horticoccus luteus]
MKKMALFLAAIAAVAAIACYLTLRVAQPRATADDIASHEWLHRELKLTDAQHQALAPIEQSFGEKQRRLADALRDANRQLARAMAEDKAYTPRVTAAVEHVHHCMGDLQKVSIEHVFAMRAVLTPEQGDKLLNLAQQALEHSP